jgi:hypothetical protein
MNSTRAEESVHRIPRRPYGLIVAGVITAVLVAQGGVAEGRPPDGTPFGYAVGGERGGRGSRLPHVASGHRPGPDILYARPPRAPQLENTRIWRADPILVSGTQAYRAGEWLYQDYLLDDHGATGVKDREEHYGISTNLYSPSAGTFTYPTDKVYANNAADLVELRVKPLPTATAAAAYRSGAITQANNLDQVAIIDLRGPDPGAFHDVYRTYALRARLEREHGTAANQALWRGFVALLGDTNYVSEGIIAIDGWLAAVEADSRDIPLAQKIIENRNVPDRCTNGAGRELPAVACDVVVQSYATPRIAAGMPFTDDVMKCQLKPLRRSDYYPITFNDAQWATLEATFPTGVCDYSKPGQYQQNTIAWQTYQKADGSVIYGGEPLGPHPVSTPIAAHQSG